VTCPTVGPALDRIACELHQANLPKPLADRLLDPVFLVSVVALVLAAGALVLSLRQRRELNSREGRGERAEVMDQGMSALDALWVKPDSGDGSAAAAYKAASNRLTRMNQVGSMEVAQALYLLNSVELPTDEQHRAVIGRRLHHAAFNVFRGWLDDPFGTRRRAMVIARRVVFWTVLKRERLAKRHGDRPLPEPPAPGNP
jgi:hypothetical protein